MRTQFTPQDLIKGTAAVSKAELKQAQKAQDEARKKRKPEVDKLVDEVWQAGIDQKFDGVNVKAISFTLPVNTDAEVKRDAEIRLTEQQWVVSGDDVWDISPKSLRPQSKRCFLKPWTWFRR
jgi:hypothetical protein